MFLNICKEAQGNIWNDYIIGKDYIIFKKDCKKLRLLDFMGESHNKIK